jgi:hypothetical protein
MSPTPPPRPRPVIGDSVLSHATVVVRRARGHRRHHDAVLDGDAADARGGEEDGHGGL